MVPCMPLAWKYTPESASPVAYCRRHPPGVFGWRFHLLLFQNVPDPGCVVVVRLCRPPPVSRALDNAKLAVLVLSTTATAVLEAEYFIAFMPNIFERYSEPGKALGKVAICSSINTCSKSSTNTTARPRDAPQSNGQLRQTFEPRYLCTQSDAAPDIHSQKATW